MWPWIVISCVIAAFVCCFVHQLIVHYCHSLSGGLEEPSQLQAPQRMIWPEYERRAVSARRMRGRKAWMRPRLSSSSHRSTDMSENTLGQPQLLSTPSVTVANQMPSWITRTKGTVTQSATAGSFRHNGKHNHASFAAVDGSRLFRMSFLFRIWRSRERTCAGGHCEISRHASRHSTTTQICTSVQTV